MKKLIVTSIFLLVYVFCIQSQSISAGLHDIYDYYYDVIPDYEIIPEELWLISYSELYPVDINGDGLSDFSLQSRFDDGNFHIWYCKLFPGGHCEVSYFVDTCFADTSGSFCGGAVDKFFNIAKVYEYNELIDNSALWFKGEEVIINQDYSVPCYDCRFSNEETYLGIRIFDQSDTLYGWVKLGNMNSFRMTLEEFACNTKSAGLNDHEQCLKIYPNPCSSIINISTAFSWRKGIISISDKLGQILYTQTISGKINNIDVSDFPGGVFFVKYLVEDKCVVHTIIKQ